jgi:hypothetical protein
MARRDNREYREYLREEQRSQRGCIAVRMQMELHYGLPRPCYRIAAMSEHELRIRCMRCGEQMDMRDPGPGMAWTPDQFWVCPRCGRHFWTTYPPPAKPKPAEPAAKPADPAS